MAAGIRVEWEQGVGTGWTWGNGSFGLLGPLRRTWDVEGDDIPAVGEASRPPHNAGRVSSNSQGQGLQEGFGTKRREMVRIAIIEDSEFLRTGLRVALEADGCMEVVGEFGLNEEVVSDVEQLRPDVVLLGVRWPDLNRSALICRLLRSAYAPTRVVMLSPGARENEVLTAIVSGASGHVSIDVPNHELVHAVRLAVNGGAHFERGVAERVIGLLEQNRPPLEEGPDLQRLSARERLILSMLADGLTNHEIGEGLGIATSTVRNNLTNIRAKLELDSRTKLVRFAYEQGLTRLVTAGFPLHEDTPGVISPPIV